MKITVEYSLMGGFTIKVRSDDSDVFREAIESLKSYVEPSMRAWQPAAKCWRVDASAEFEMGEWLALCTAEFHAEVTRTYARRQGRQTRATPKPEADPFAALHLLPSAPVEVVKAAYKALAVIHHPDKGGDARRMQEINAAYTAATGRLAA